MNTNRGDMDDYGVYRDVAAFFEAEASEEELERLRVEHSEEQAQSNGLKGEHSEGTTLTLEKGDVKVSIAESMYLSLMAQTGVSPNWLQSNQVACWMRIAAEKRGLKALAAELDRLYKSTAVGPILVRHGGQFYSPLPVSTQTAKAAEPDSVTNDVSVFFSRDEDGK